MTHSQRQLADFSVHARDPVHTQTQHTNINTTTVYPHEHIHSHTVPNKTPMLNYAHKYLHTSQPSVGL